MASAYALVANIAGTLWIAAQLLILSAVLFGGLAVLIRGEEAIHALKRAATEIRINVALYLIDAAFIAPVVGLLVHLIRGILSHADAFLVPPSVWSSLGNPVTFLAVIFLGDFGSYWRHRMEHTRLLWPAHAVHHSDTDMSWLTLSRFHPLNRVTTSAVDITFLAVLGFPGWALVSNEIIRHYYGEFIHADVPWTYGPLKTLFVSPAMHRWHHARDVVGSGSNFATVFAVFDRAFHTYHCPGPCNVPLGVTDNINPTTIGQLVYPFVAWSEDFMLRRRRPAEPSPIDAVPSSEPGPTVGHITG